MACLWWHITFSKLSSVKIGKGKIGTRVADLADVLEQEPPAIHHPLVHHPKVIITPHTGWHTAESVKSLTTQCIKNLCDYLRSYQ